MRFVRPLTALLSSAGVVACTAILGDFSVENGIGGSSTDGGGDDVTGGGGEAGAITVTPDQGKMGIFRSLEFKANQDVNWSVQEPDAGTISAKGILYSGSKPGTYHVIATSKSDPSKSVTVPVIVVNLAIQVLVGPNGGAGNIDGPRKVAHFNSPRGVVGDYDQSEQTNKYFIADTENHTIRMFVEKPSPGGAVTTIAGKSGALGFADGVGDVARFNEPTFMGYDAPNKLVFVVDGRGKCIRKIDTATNTVSTVAGNCTAAGTFSQISAMTMSGDHHRWLYVCDSTLKRVVLVNDPIAGLVAGAVTNATANTEYCDMVTSSNSNQVNYPGYVWYGQTYGGDVRHFYEGNTFPMAAANISTITVVPNVNNPLGYEGSIAYVSNSLWFSGQSTLYKLDNAQTPGQTFPTTPVLGVLDDRRVIDGTTAATVRLGRPAHLAVYASYGLMFPDTGAHAIRSLRNPGFNAEVETTIGASFVTDRVDGPRASARLTGPFSITADEAGIIYFGDFAFDNTVLNSTIRKYDRTTATVTTVAGVPTEPGDVNNPPVDGPKDQARFWFPINMAYAKGKLFVVDSWAQAIREVDAATGQVKTLAGGLAAAPGYVDDIGAAARFSFYAYPSGSGGSFASFFGGALTTDGTDLFVADSLNYRVRKVNPVTGAVTTIAGSGIQGSLNNADPKLAQFMTPMGLAYYDGVLYICDYEDSTIRRMNIQTGAIDTFIGLSGVPGDLDGDASKATINGPFRLVADGIGNLYLTSLTFASGGDGLNLSGTIRRINIKDRTISTFAGTPGKVGLQAGPVPSTVNFPSALARMPNNDLAFGDFTEATLAIIQPL